MAAVYIVFPFNTRVVVAVVFDRFSAEPYSTFDDRAGGGHGGYGQRGGGGNGGFGGGKGGRGGRNNFRERWSTDRMIGGGGKCHEIGSFLLPFISLIYLG